MSLALDDLDLEVAYAVEADADRADAEAIRASLSRFVRWSWHIVEPGTPLEWNWHLDLLCDELERVTSGEVRELVVCIPPGTMKSLTVSVFWLAWEWLRKPELRVLFTSNDDDLVKRDSLRTRAILESEEYRDLLHILYGDGTGDWYLASDQNQKHWFENSRKGFRQCFPYGGRFTGKRGFRAVVDDPYDVKDTMGPIERVAARMAEGTQVFHSALASRLNDQRTGQRVVIMQRVHPDDLAGDLLRSGWRHLVLPMEFDSRHPYRNERDPRTEDGELLDPVRFPQGVVDNTKRTMGQRDYQAQYQQLPTIPEGGMFKRECWVLLPRSQYPTTFDRVWMGADLAFKGETQNDYCAFYVLGRKGSVRYVLDRVRLQLNYGAQKQELRRLAEVWPEAVAKCVENKANAFALLDDLKGEVEGIILVPAREDKVTRAQTWQPLQEARNIVLPEDAPWTDEVIEQHAEFPNGSYDDDIDALGHALLWDMQHPFQDTVVALPSMSVASYWR